MRLGLTAPDAGSISYFSGSAGKAVMQMPHDALTTKDTPRSKYGDTLWCGCAALVSGPGAIPAGNMQRIRRYTRLAVNPVATMQQVHHHLSAAVERMARVFLIDQALGHFAKLDRHDRSAFGLDRRTRHAGQNALAFLRQIGMNADPTVPDHGRLIPYFF